MKNAQDFRWLALVITFSAACSASSTKSPQGGTGGNTAGESGEGGGQAGMQASGGSAVDNTGGSATNLGGAGGTTTTATGGTNISTGGAGAGQSTGGSGGAAKPLFTHDFEGDAVGSPPKGMWSGDGAGNVKVATDKAFSGKNSLKVVSSNGESMVTLATNKILPAPRKTAYVRFMLWMDGLPGSNGQTGSTASHWDLISQQGLIKGGGLTLNGYYSFGGFADSSYKFHFFGDVTSGTGRSDCVKQATLTLPLKAWTCVEMKIDENELLQYGVSINNKPIQSFSFFADGAFPNCVTEWNVTKGIFYIPEIASTKLGFRHIHNQGKTVTLWIDDVAVDTKPIGCPAP
jgi:hypothetical protein